MNDSTYTEWRPSPPLEAAVRKALQALARHWPRAMAMASDSTTAGAAYVADYARAMNGADLAAIPHAAQLWLRDHETPPKPSELGRMARELSKQLRGVEPAAPATVPPPVHGTPSRRMIEHLNAKAAAQLAATGPGWGRVAMVWALLWETAPDEAARDAVRMGNVPLQVFMDAVAAVERGKRPQSAVGGVGQALPGALGRRGPQ